MTPLETILSLALNARLKQQPVTIPADHLDALCEIIESHVHCKIHHARAGKAGRPTLFGHKLSEAEKQARKRRKALTGSPD